LRDGEYETSRAGILGRTCDRPGVAKRLMVRKFWIRSEREDAIPVGGLLPA
jgi:hypothetical protein